MDIQIRWQAPYDLVDGSGIGLIYDVSDFDYLPAGPGVYVFARKHGRRVTPMYIGRALRIRRRVDKQLNNLRLMNAVWNAPRGRRKLYVGEMRLKPGQQLDRVLAIAESALIQAASIDGHRLLNVQGTALPAHLISSSGNREAQRWMASREMWAGW